MSTTASVPFTFMEMIGRLFFSLVFIQAIKFIWDQASDVDKESKLCVYPG